jgi:hypothetical protein
MFALVLMSSQAMAVNFSNLKADSADLIRNLKSQKVLCKDVAAPMAQLNMKFGMQVLMIASQAEQAEKDGKLDVVAQANEAVAAIQKQSDALNEAFNAKCVKLEEVFTEIADEPAAPTTPAAADTTGGKPLTPAGN